MLLIFLWMQENYACVQLSSIGFFRAVFKGGSIKVPILWVLLKPRGSFELYYIKAIRLFLYSFLALTLYITFFFSFMLKKIKDVDVRPEVKYRSKASLQGPCRILAQHVAIPETKWNDFLYFKPLPALTLPPIVQQPVRQCELFWSSAFEERYNYWGVMFPVDQPWANEESGISGMRCTGKWLWAWEFFCSFTCVKSGENIFGMRNSHLDLVKKKTWFNFLTCRGGTSKQ